MKTTWYLKRAHRSAAIVVAVVAGLATASCATEADSGPHELAGVRAAERSVGSAPATVDGKPAAVIGNVEVSWEDLRARLGEAAGGAVLEEIVLDHQLRGQMAERGIVIGPGEVAAEREKLVETLRRNSSADQEQSARLITGLQRSRGLGPARFAALLERNAMLRRLVRDEVAVDSSAVDRELMVRYGAKKQCRLIMVGSEAEASRLRGRLSAPDAVSSLEDRFAAEARMVSLDPSAKEGGMLAPISAVDVSYAAAVRRAVEGLSPGEVSPVVVLDRGFAVLYCVANAPGTEAPARARGEVEEELLLRQERIAMDRLAQRLINSANPTVLDPSLNWSWTNRRAAGERAN